jgi:hypothetical protein
VFLVGSTASSTCEMLGTIQDRANMYKERILLGRQRLLRSGKFTIKGMSAIVSGQKHDQGHEVKLCLLSIYTNIHQVPSRFFI